MFRRKRSDADFRAEVEAHIELEAARLREQGLSAEEALAAARRAFGNRTAARERFHERRRWLWLDHLTQDLRFAARLLRKTPGWTTVAALTAALGIGASVAMFSVVYAALLRPLPYPDADRLYWIKEQSEYTLNGQVQSSDRESASIDKYVLLRDNARQLESVAAWDILSPIWFTGEGPRQLQGAIVTAEFFDTLGVQPLYGRTFRPDEIGTQGVAIISYGLWQRAFGGDPAVLGRSFRMTVRQTMPVTIVGIMPPGFDFPHNDGVPREIWTPWPFPPTLRSVVSRILVRARPDATGAGIAADLERLGDLVRSAQPAFSGVTGRRNDYYAEPLRDHLRGNTRRPLLVFTGAVTLMLLIVCFNIANLLLARATTRQREIAVRAALGAPPHRIVQQLLTESLLIALAGGCLGVGLARVALAAFNGSSQAISLGMPQVAIDAPVAAFAIALMLLTGMVFGLAPAWSALGFTVRDALQRDSHSSSTGTGSRHARQVLVVGQLAFSLTLLIGAGLLAKSYYQIWSTDPGFDPRNLVVVSSGRRASVPAADQARLIEELRAVPGVESVALTNGEPGTGEIGGIDLTIAGRPERIHSQWIAVSPDYFGTLGVPLLRGRLFATREAGNSPTPVVVNEAFARQYLAGQNPLGQTVTMPGSKPPVPGLAELDPHDYTIVGMVGDFRQHELEQEPELMVYEPLSGGLASPVIRTRADARPLLPTIQRIVAAYRPEQAPPDVATVDQLFSDSLRSRRFNAAVIGGFALVALLLAVMGVYGVMSYLVALRTKEVGIRMALGARPANVLVMILKEGAVLGVIGAIAGLAGAAGLTRYLASLLLNVSPYDPATFAVLTAVVLAAVVAACYVPGQRAAESDPLTVLRHD